MFEPVWAAPAQVGAAVSGRSGGRFGGRIGGISHPPWDSLNLAEHVGDSVAAVAHNRQCFAQALDAEPVWLNQEHGVHVARVGRADLGRPSPVADAAWTTVPGIACAVLVADCLPVLFALRDGSAVAAAHAGWRGLASGVLEATLMALQQGTGATPRDIVVWLGPCIGPQHFEVGADVLQAFGLQPTAPPHARFVSRPRPNGEPRWLADLAGLAQDRLHRAGLQHIACDGRCTASDASALFSFRRDGITGRQAAAVWRRR